MLYFCLCTKFRSHFTIHLSTVSQSVSGMCKAPFEFVTLYQYEKSISYNWKNTCKLFCMCITYKLTKELYTSLRQYAVISRKQKDVIMHIGKFPEKSVFEENDQKSSNQVVHSFIHSNSHVFIHSFIPIFIQSVIPSFISIVIARKLFTDLLLIYL